MDASFGGSASNPLLRVQGEGRPGIVPLVTLVFCVMWKGYLNVPVPQQWEDTEAHRRSLRVLVGHLPVRTLDRVTMSRKSQPDCGGSDQSPLLESPQSLPSQNRPWALPAAQVMAAGMETKAHNQQEKTF